MLHTETVAPGSTGAKRQSYAEPNPREVLLRISKKEHDMDELREKVWLAVTKDQQMQRTIYEYWFANNYKSITMAQHKTGRRPASAIAKATNEVRRQLEAHIEQEVNIRLLDMMMPSGKTLSASTREELSVVGGWALRIADRLQVGQTVAEAGLTEDDLLTLYKG